MRTCFQVSRVWCFAMVLGGTETVRLTLSGKEWHSRGTTTRSNVRDGESMTRATIRERHGEALGERHVRKPIGWECNDHITFNNTVRTQLNASSGPSGQGLRETSSFALYVYTGGSARDKDANTEMRWVGIHSHDKTSSPWGQADD